MWDRVILVQAVRALLSARKRSRSTRSCAGANAGARSATTSQASSSCDCQRKLVVIVHQSRPHRCRSRPPRARPGGACWRGGRPVGLPSRRAHMAARLSNPRHPTSPNHRVLRAVAGGEPRRRMRRVPGHPSQPALAGRQRAARHAAHLLSHEPHAGHFQRRAL